MKNRTTSRLIIFSAFFITISAARTLAAGGDLDTTFTAGVANFSSAANVAVVQPDGRILVGGTFTIVNGRSFNRLVRLNADGSVDQSFDIGAGFSQPVNAIAVQPDGGILIGGSFVNFGGVAGRNYLVRLNPHGSFDTTFNTNGAGANNPVDVITLQSDGRILIGGFAITNYNGTTIGRLARLNTDGSLDTAFNTNLGTGFNNATNAIAIEPDGQIVVGGNFTGVGGTTANRIARLNANGTRDTAFIINTGTGFNQFINEVALQQDGRILVGGNFSSFNSTPRNRIARLNSNGTLDANWTLIPASSVTAIVVQPDGQFFVVGENGASFGTGASQRRSIARLNATDGSIDLNFNAGAGVDGVSFRSLALQPDDTILIAGNFTSVNSNTRSALAKLNRDGSLDPDFTVVIGAPAQVDAIHVLPDDRVLIGGNFRGVNESFRSRIARLNTDGSVDPAFNPGVGGNASSSVFAIGVQTDNRILVGGSFTNFGGAANNGGIARLNADGSLDATFNARVFGTVGAIAIQTDGRILIGGTFTAVNGASGVNRIARLNSNGTTDPTFNTGAGFSSNVEDLVVGANNGILVVGSFTSYNGTPGINRIAHLNSDGTLDASFTANAGFDSTVNTLALQPDGGILVGGFFLNFNNASSERIVRLEQSGTRDASFNVGAGFGNLVNDFNPQPDGRILVVGNFTTYNNVTRRHLARLNADGTLDASFRSGVAVNNELRAVGLQADGRIIIGGALQSYDGTPRFGIARLSAGDTITWTGAVDTNWSNAANWSTGNVPTAADNAVIPNDFTVNLSGGNFDVLTLTMGANATLTIAAGSRLAIEGGTNNGTIAGAGRLDFVGTALGNNNTISVSVVNILPGTSRNKSLTGAGAFVGNVLTVASGVTLALQNNHVFNELDLESNANFNSTSRTINLRGANPLRGLGAVNTAFGTIVFDGATPQTVSRTLSFHNLTINNPSGVTLDGNAFYSVAGTLALTSGILNVNSSTPLSFDDDAIATRASGYLTGTARKDFNAPALPPFTFPLGTANGYSPVTVHVTNGTTEITASVTQTSQPLMNSSTSLRRYWTLHGTGNFTANLAFNYLPDDVFGNEGNYRITRVAGERLTVFANDCAAAAPCVNTAANAATINNVTQLADWTLSESAPTVTLTPVADAWVQGADAFRDTNYGTSPELQVKRTFNPGAGRGRRALLTFDTAPVAGDITRARLRLFARLSHPSLANIPVRIQKVTDTNWNEASVTWNTQPGVASPAALAPDAIVASATGAYYDYDLTAFLRAERAANRHVVSFRLINIERTGTSGAFYTSVNSRETQNPPLLVIEQ